MSSPCNLFVYTYAVKNVDRAKALDTGLLKWNYIRKKGKTTVIVAWPDAGDSTGDSQDVTYVTYNENN